MAINNGREYYFCGNHCKGLFMTNPEKYQDSIEAQRLTVGVMGSASASTGVEVLRRARRLGKLIADQGLILITGACPGLPHECARGAHENGGLSVGVSPALSLDEHLYKYHSPNDAFDVLIYTGSGLMGREVTNIRSSDMVVIAGGRSGTLGEFSIAYDEGKLIGVLKGSGGIVGQLPSLVRKIDKDTGSVVIYEADPAVLLERLLNVYCEEHFRRPSCFCENDEVLAG